MNFSYYKPYLCQQKFNTNLVPIIRMENQSSDLDALTRRRSLSLGIGKCRMSNSSSSPVGLRVEALNQCDHLWSLRVAIIPPVRRVRSHGVSLSRSVGVDERDTDEIAVRNREGIRDSQWVLVNGLYGTPDIDNLVATLEKLRCIIRKVEADTALACLVRLIDMHALHWTSKLSIGCRTVVLRSSSDSVIKNEDTGSSGSMLQIAISYVFPRYCSFKPWYNLRVLQQLFRLGIILPLDFLIIQKVFLFAFMIVDLEAIAI